MKKLLTAPLLIISLLFFTDCSKDDSAQPQETAKTLTNTKWDLTTLSTDTEDSNIGSGERVYFHFTDEANLKRINEYTCCPATAKEYTYQLKNDTLITNDKSYLNYFKITEHTSTRLALRNFKVVSLMDGQVFISDPVYTYKFNKVAN